MPAFTRYYRNEMLGRLRGEAMLRYDDDYRREVVHHVRMLATTRIPPAVHEALPMFLRVQSRLLLDGDIDGLVAYAGELERIRLIARTGPPRWASGRLGLRLDAWLRRGDEPLHLEPDGEGWALPESMAPGVPIADRRLRDTADVDIDLATISRADAQLWSTTEGLSLSLEDGCPRVRCPVEVDPWHVLGGSALASGLWDLRLRLMFGGLTRTSALRPMDDGAALPVGSWLARVAGEERSASAYWTHPSPALALDVDAWMHALHDEIDDPHEAPPTVRGRRLELSARNVLGETGTTRPARVVLTPVPPSAGGPLTCSAVVECAPEGSTVRATVPRGARTTGGGWRVWLSLDDPGGAAPRPLPLSVNTGRWGRLAATADAGPDAAEDPV
jgi:hypothetical protein